MAAEPQRNPLPFEPSKKPPKVAKTTNKPEKTANKSAKTASKSEKKQPSAYKPQPKPAVSSKKTEKVPPYTKEEMAVPKVVSDRMARRMAVFCGVPTVLGMATLIAGYIVLSRGWFHPPHVAVLLVSMGFLGLSVLGLTYGILSASWDEQAAGSVLGWQEFAVNWGRMMAAWRSTRQKNV